MSRILPCQFMSTSRNTRNTQENRISIDILCRGSKPIPVRVKCQKRDIIKRVNTKKRDTYIVKESNKKQGTLIGAISLITGTSIGVGILALPAKTLATGFIPSACVMGASWILLLVEALLIVEVNTALRRNPSSSLSKVISIRTMAETTLGKLGGSIVGIFYVFLTYALMVAYISEAGEVLSLLFNLPKAFAQFLFTFLFGNLILFGGTGLADQVNQAMTAGLIALFFLLVIGGSSYHGDWQALLHQDWAAAPESIPVIFLALVYHDLIPVICTYLDGDVERIRLAVILGSAVPLAMLLIWNALALSLAPVSGEADPIAFLMRNGGAGPAFTVQLFSILAILTSTIGSVLGMSEFYIEQLSCSTKTYLEFYTKGWRAFPKLIRTVSFMLVLVPPLLLSLSIPDAFFAASDLAGGCGMTSLYGILPPVMAWGLVKNPHESTGIPLSSRYSERSWITQHGTLAVTGLCACGIIVGQLFLRFY